MFIKPVYVYQTSLCLLGLYVITRSVCLPVRVYQTCLFVQNLLVFTRPVCVYQTCLCLPVCVYQISLCLPDLFVSICLCLSVFVVFTRSVYVYLFVFKGPV